MPTSTFSCFKKATRKCIAVIYMYRKQVTKVIVGVGGCRKVNLSLNRNYSFFVFNAMSLKYLRFMIDEYVELSPGLSRFCPRFVTGAIPPIYLLKRNLYIYYHFL